MRAGARTLTQNRAPILRFSNNISIYSTPQRLSVNHLYFKNIIYIYFALKINTQNTRIVFRYANKTWSLGKDEPLERT